MISNAPYSETNGTGRKKISGEIAAAVVGFGLVACKLFPNLSGAGEDEKSGKW